METKSETRKVGKYELVSRLGEGSYAKVYKGRDDTTGTEYALKVISKDKLGSHNNSCSHSITHSLSKT